MASARADFILPAQPEPGTAQQAGGDRPAVWAVGLAKSYGPTVALIASATTSVPGTSDRCRLEANSA